MASLNGDMRVRAHMDTGSMEWQASPSGTVQRRRVHLVGEPEAGQVTSVVRYLPGATFPAHDHPGGEEILVLEGTFSDEHGDWPAGTYLLNPEGFRHAPFSEKGCLLLVKLRQYAGEDRTHVAVQTLDLDWCANQRAGVRVKQLYSGGVGDAEVMRLERWEAGARPGVARFPGGVEIFVLDGELRDENGRYPKGAWLRVPPGAELDAASPGGCELYVKAGGVLALRSG
jgi:anti-sigma factor ChrR (cupin superfamily)